MKFNFSLILNVPLTKEEIWPDGDAPENPTLQDVLSVLEDDGFCVDRKTSCVYSSSDVRRLIDDWGLMNEEDASVRITEA